MSNQEEWKKQLEGWIDTLKKWINNLIWVGIGIGIFSGVMFIIGSMMVIFREEGKYVLKYVIGFFFIGELSVIIIPLIVLLIMVIILTKHLTEL